MSLLKSGLLRELSPRHEALIDPAYKFKTKKLVEMLKVHREKSDRNHITKQHE